MPRFSIRSAKSWVSFASPSSDRDDRMVPPGQRVKPSAAISLRNRADSPPSRASPRHPTRGRRARSARRRRSPGPACWRTDRPRALAQHRDPRAGRWYSRPRRRPAPCRACRSGCRPALDPAARASRAPSPRHSRWRGCHRPSPSRHSARRGPQIAARSATIPSIENTPSVAIIRCRAPRPRCSKALPDRPCRCWHSASAAPCRAAPRRSPRHG